MNQSETRFSRDRPPSRNQVSIGLSKVGWFVAVAVMAWSAPIQGSEIHEAAELGNLEKVKACLAQDPKLLDTKDAKGRTVMTRASLSGKKELVEFLLEKGVPEDIFAAAIVGHTTKIEAFLKEDKNLVNAKDSGDKTALHWAALYGQKEVVKLLLAQKANVNALDEHGFTPLHWAATFDRSEAAEVLLANKANMNLKVPKFGWTPLRLTVIHGHKATAEALLKAGANPNLKDEENMPLLHQAVIAGKTEMVRLLIAHKCDINEKDESGDTPLHEALEHGNREIIEFLRQHGAKEK